MKKYLVKLLIATIPVFAFFIFGYHLVKNYNWGGDMGKLGRYFFDTQYIKDWHTYKAHTDYLRNFRLDSMPKGNFNFLNIGDSFSDYNLNGNTYNCIFSNLIKDSILYESGWINGDDAEQRFIKILNNYNNLPKYAIIESVERGFISKINNIDFNDKTINIPKNEQYRNKDKFELYKNINSITDLYKKILFNHLPAEKVKLKEEKFSAKGDESNLYFYQHDLNFPTQEEIDCAVIKLDSLYNFAKSKGVTLIYIVAADKYDFYQNYILNNKYPSKTTLDSFAKKNKIPHFINTKTILDSADKQGVKDIYWADDTHWSQIGNKIVGEYLYNYIKNISE